jgi:hypothetical protein
MCGAGHGMTACTESLLVNPAPAPTQLLVSYAVSAATAGSEGPGRSFDRADALRVQVSRSAGAALDTIIPFVSAGAVTHVPLRLDVRDEQEPVGIAFELRRSSDVLFRGSADVLVTRGDTTRVDLALIPVPAAAQLPAAIPPLTALGDTVTIAAAVVFATGDTIPDVPLVWTSGTPAVATVTQAGLVTAHAEGQTEIRVTHAGFSASVQLQVAALVTSVTVQPATQTIVVAQTRPVTATARDRRGNSLARTFTWTSSNPAVASVVASGPQSASVTGVCTGVEHGDCHDPGRERQRHHRRDPSARRQRDRRADHHQPARRPDRAADGHAAGCRRPATQPAGLLEQHQSRHRLRQPVRSHNGDLARHRDHYRHQRRRQRHSRRHCFRHVLRGRLRERPAVVGIRPLEPHDGRRHRQYAVPVVRRPRRGRRQRGELPPAPQGSWYVWFGRPATGNYIGQQLIDDSQHSGGTSQAPVQGSLTSPPFTIPADVTGVFLNFTTWFEIESINPDIADLMEISLIDVTGSPLVTILLNPAEADESYSAHPFTSGGYWQPPVFTQHTVPIAGLSGHTVHLVFTFNTVDTQRNGFRGWIMDNVSVTQQPPPPGNLSFSASAGPAASTLRVCAGTCPALPATRQP